MRADSELASIRQKQPLPASSWARGTLTKYLFRERLCRMEFWESKFNKHAFKDVSCDDDIDTNDSDGNSFNKRSG